MLVRWVDIDEITPPGLTRKNDSAVGQYATDNNQRHTTVSGSSQYCHATAAGDNSSTRASTTAKAVPSQTIPPNKVFTRDMKTPPPPGSDHPRTAAILFLQELSRRTLENRNIKLPPDRLRRLFADPSGQDCPHFLDQFIDDNFMMGRLLGPTARTGAPADLAPGRRSSFSNLRDHADDFNAEEADGAESSPTVREIPLRQHEPSAETVDISLPPASSSGWDNDDCEDSPKRLLTISPEPLPESSLDIFKKRDEGNEKLPAGESQITAQTPSTESAAQPLEDIAEEQSLETPRTPINENACQSDFSPIIYSLRDDGFQNSPNVPEHQKSSPSIPSSPINPSPKTQVKCSVSKSAKQDASADTFEKPNSPEEEDTDTTPRTDMNVPSEGDPHESYLIQQFGNSPSSSQDARTAFVRSWIFHGESNPKGQEAFSDPKAPTRESSVVSDDALDECSKSCESQKDETEKTARVEDNGDLISLRASPSPSSKLEMPWTSTESKDAVLYHYKEEDFSAPKVMPFTETIDGSTAIAFPVNVIQGTFIIHVVATSDFNCIYNGGWREFTFPGFEVQSRGHRGTLLFNFPLNCGAFEFNTDALPWASIDGGSLLAQFELSEGITLPVNMLHTPTHTLIGGFTIENTIKSRYSLFENIKDCFTIENTATCEFKVTRQNFWAERCCFHILLEGGPWGRFEYALDKHDWHVRLNTDECFFVGDTEIKITCPFKDIGKPFRITWAVDMKGLPAKGWVPKVRPISPDEHSPRPAWSQNLAMQYEGAVSTTAMDDVADNESDLEEIPDDQDETVDCSMENHVESQDAPEDEVCDDCDPETVQYSENILEDDDRFASRVHGRKSESDTSSEFIDHPGGPWLEPKFGMVTFFIPLLFIIAELLSKIIGHKIRQIGCFLKTSIRRVSIRTWLKIGSLVYLGSLSMGASPIQRLDEIVHALAVVERQATVTMTSPLRGREEETLVGGKPRLLIMESSIENFCNILGDLEPGVLKDGFLASVPADDTWERLKERANGKPDKPVGPKRAENDQRGYSGGSSESQNERKVNRETDTVSVSIANPVPLQPGQTSQVKIPSMRDKIDQILGWRDPEVF